MDKKRSLLDMLNNELYHKECESELILNGLDHLTW